MEIEAIHAPAEEVTKRSLAILVISSKHMNTGTYYHGETRQQGSGGQHRDPLNRNHGKQVAS